MRAWPFVVLSADVVLSMIVLQAGRLPGRAVADHVFVLGHLAQGQADLCPARGRDQHQPAHAARASCTDRSPEAPATPSPGQQHGAGTSAAG